MEYKQAYALTQKFLEILRPVAVRIETVGSVKRADNKALTQGVHDIEFLLIQDPSRIPPVFGGGLDQPKNKLERLIAEMKADGLITDPSRKANGEKYKKFSITGLQELNEFHLELFIVTERTWAIQNVIRTGPSAFSQRFVTNESEVCYHQATGRKYKGLLPDYYQYIKGETEIRVRNTGEVLVLHEEADAIRLLGLRESENYWIPPEDRWKYT